MNTPKNPNQISQSKFFTRNLYDSCNDSLYLKQSTGKNDWIFNTPQEHNDVCFLDQSPFVNTRSYGVFNTDVESELKGQTRIISKCPQYNYPSKGYFKSGVNKAIKNCNPDISKFLTTNYTRSKKSCNMNTKINNNGLLFDPIFDNVQDFNKISDNLQIGVSTRIQTKKNFEFLAPKRK